MRWGERKREQYSGLVHFQRFFRSLKVWQLVILLFLSLLLTASMFRLNSLGMDARRAAVMKADESGNAEQLKTSLLELRRYVNGHMNTSLGSGFYLTQTYERDKAAALEAAGNSTNPNAEEYQKASIECRAKWQGGVDSFRNDYVKCVEERIAALGAASDVEAVIPPSDLYKITYASPLWSADPAGLSMLLSLFLLAAIFWKLLWYLLFRVIVKQRYKHA